LEPRIYWVEDRPLAKPPKEWIGAMLEAVLE